MDVDGCLAGRVAAVTVDGRLEGQRPAAALRDDARADVADADRAGALVHPARHDERPLGNAERFGGGRRERADDRAGCDQLRQPLRAYPDGSSIGSHQRRSTMSKRSEVQATPPSVTKRPVSRCRMKSSTRRNRRARANTSGS